MRLLQLWFTGSLLPGITGLGTLKAASFSRTIGNFIREMEFVPWWIWLLVVQPSAESLCLCNKRCQLEQDQTMAITHTYSCKVNRDVCRLDARPISQGFDKSAASGPKHKTPKTKGNKLELESVELVIFKFRQKCLFAFQARKALAWSQNSSGSNSQNEGHCSCFWIPQVLNPGLGLPDQNPESAPDRNPVCRLPGVPRATCLE